MAQSSLLALSIIPVLWCTALAADQAPVYTRKQLRDAIVSASSPADHRQLAAYFRAQEKAFRDKEAEQNRILQNYYESHKNHPGKYPTRGDTARHLASQYSAQAQQAAASATEQERLAR